MSLVESPLPPHDDAVWHDALAAIRSGLRNAPPRWEGIFGPLRTGLVDDLMVVGQIGQSLDGRTATMTGHSHYINGSEGLDHLHRLRALVDAVVIGVGTAIVDDPLLTVRRVGGPHPVRVIIDPNGRLPACARALCEDGVERLIVTREGARPLPGIEHIALPFENGQVSGQVAPSAILGRLAERGLRRILIEGGAGTISRFLEAHCLDRLHVVVAPIILGGGRSGLDLTPIARCEEALRPPTRAHLLGNEVLFDCDLRDQRVPIGAAKKSR
jgi:diaminohydroxyphosphoribosylaminopyrimidine deaminase / 5-amino-6-(5-phosphoribosylamino)uracil reductase